jgi:endoglucanase
VLASHPDVSVYLDAGNSNWHTASDIAGRLEQAGVDQAQGFALNVSNFVATATETQYGDAVSALIGGKHFVVDTSRNGRGPTPDAQWCNPSGRALGDRPTAATGDPLADAYLWIKHPGESDGTCNGGPSAGEWWADYALGLAQRAAY